MVVCQVKTDSDVIMLTDSIVAAIIPNAGYLTYL